MSKAQCLYIELREMASFELGKERSLISDSLPSSKLTISLHSIYLSHVTNAHFRSSQVSYHSG